MLPAGEETGPGYGTYPGAVPVASRRGRRHRRGALRPEGPVRWRPVEPRRRGAILPGRRRRSGSRRGLVPGEETRRLELVPNLPDGQFEVARPPGSGAHEFAAGEEKHDDPGLVESVDQSGELFGLVFDPVEPEGDRDDVEVDLTSEVRRRDDVLDLDFRVLRDLLAGFPDLRGDRTDRVVDLLPALPAGADRLPGVEQEDRRLRRLHPVDEPRELA